MNLWLLNFAICLLSAVNAVSWGLCIREVGTPHLNLEFLFKLGLNKFFISAMGSAFLAALLKYNVTHTMGVLKSWFFLATSTASIIIVCYLFLGERLTLLDWLGIGLILAGVYLIGR